MSNFDYLYDNKYFANRNFNDKKRIASFIQEKTFLEKYMSLDGVVCDVGCSTGEFLTTIGWSGSKFGMDVNPEAIKSAQKHGVSFLKNILTEKNFFDAIIFRGTIQHIPDPFGYIASAYDSLKMGGFIAFLATPNANSLVYKFFNTLPALDPKYNFYIPSDVTLSNVLENYNFELLEISKPYINSPYASPIEDHFKFFKAAMLGRKPDFAFWGNMMNIIAIKR